MRGRRASTGDEPTLFPFLAVLICTVGSLIVLLVVMMQQAKATATDRSRQRGQEQQAAADEVEQVQLDVDELQWRIKGLQESRQKTIDDLKARETELSYMEDEIRQLRARLDRAAAEATHIEQLAKEKDGDRHASQSELDRLREQLDKSRESLELARKAFHRGERSYALVPYNGANGTRRRPIYIECTADRVILQPEGVELYSEDFHDPMTSDNALAAALRAQREYFADATRDRKEPPYPLIIVRPDGSHAYAAARAAMEEWDAEFGYELVDDDMKLSFPEVDAALVDVVREAVDEARARRQLLQSIAPARFGRGQPVLTASRNGGFVTTGSPGSDDAESSGDRFGPHFAPTTRTSGDSFTPANSSRGEPPSAGNPTGNPFGSGVGGGPGGVGSSSSVSGPERGARGQGQHAPEAGGTAAGDYANQTVAETGGQSSNRSGGPESSGERATRGQSDHTSRAARQHGSTSPADTAGPGGAAHSGQAGTAGAAGAGASAAMGYPGAASGVGGGGMGGSMDLTAQASSLASSRGADWGLPERAVGATGITRPIHLSCYSDHLVIFPERGQGSRPHVLPIQGSLREEVDELVAKVWERIDSWGIAGNRMYWRPVLQVQVQKGGDRRFAELAQLLEGSGIVVNTK